jgi:phosphate transport system substrate-binding protein
MIAQLLGTQTGYSNMFSLGNVDTVVGYIAKNPTAIGFISFAAISDIDEPAAQAILQRVKVLPVAKADSLGKKIVIPMSQSTIASNDYPFQRYVTVVKGNTPELLGTGFVNFLYRSKASRIMLKAGLVPEKMPERQIKIVE